MKMKIFMQILIIMKIMTSLLQNRLVMTSDIDLSLISLILVLKKIIVDIVMV